MAMEMAKDISAPLNHLEIDGKEYRLRFDNGAFRVAEDVYELYYGRMLNFAQIAQQLAAGKLGAIMAMMYGAMQSAGADMSWAEFNEKFSLSSIPGVREMLVKSVQDALPEVKGGDQGADPQ